MFPVITLDRSDNPQVGRVVYAVFEQCHIDLRVVMALTWIWASNGHSGDREQHGRPNNSVVGEWANPAEARTPV